jgi:hypothetical protein
MRTIPQLRAPRNIPQFLQKLLATYKIEMAVCPGSVDQVRRHDSPGIRRLVQTILIED